jgi:ribosomal protein S18 acetylase RimI-like enzyme
MATLTDWAVRRAVHDDRSAVLELWESVGLTSADENEWQALTHGVAAKLLVSHEDGQLAGTVVVAFDGWRAYIYHVAVAPFARGRGLARALLAEAEADLRSQGARRAYVEVNDANTAGLALCTSSGFEPEGDIALVKELHG